MNLASLFHRSKPVISLFHSTTSQSSKSILKLLKETEVAREEAQKPITLEVTESAPTATQMQSIIDIIGEARIGDLVPGAIGKSDAIKIVEKDPNGIERPIVVDWGNAKVVLGGDNAKVKSLVDSV